MTTNDSTATHACVGQTFILDGKAFVFSKVEGHRAFAERADASTGKKVSVTCDVRELYEMGSGLWALPGRIETKAPADAPASEASA